jgi:hypothetical protein
MQFLASLPTWLLAVGCVVLCGAFAAGMRALLRRALPHDQLPLAQATAGPLMPALGAAFALLAALSLAGEATQLREAEEQVSGEAAAAARLAWGASSAGLDAESVQAPLLTYLQTTRALEWAGRDEQADGAALESLADLERAVRAAAETRGIGSAQAGELLTSMGAVTSSRRERLTDAHQSLPDLYVAVVALSGLALIANAAALTVAAGRHVAYLTGGLVVVVALVLALLFAISSPFRGGFVVSGYPIDQVVDDLGAGLFRR